MRIIKLIVILIVLSVVMPSFSQLKSDDNIRVIEFTQTNCEKVYDPTMIRTRIVEKYFEKDMYRITIGTLGTCCVGYKPLVSFSSGTLNLDYKEYGEECDCLCYYEFTYKLSGLKKKKFDIKFKGKQIEESSEKYITFPVQFELIGGDTINVVDKYGMRQGIWTFDSIQIRNFFVYINNVVVKKVELFADGKVHKETHKEYGNWNYYVEYYDNGQKRVECYNDQPEEFYQDGICHQWDINGELLYKGPFKEGLGN